MSALSADSVPRQPTPSQASPQGLAEAVKQLMKMPGHLCKQRGNCCRLATFKGSLTHAEILALAADPQRPGHEAARDFASLFVPVESQAQVQAMDAGFLDRVREASRDHDQDPDAVTFFSCKYVQADGRCGVHEDRPTGCRFYPFPHKNTIYHPGCGFEKMGTENWAQIENILDTLGIKA